MAYGLYSSRFITMAVVNTTVNWTVPAGKRAVIRCVTFTNSSPADSGIYYLTLKGGNLVIDRLQAQTTHVLGDLRVVVYGGEVLGTFINQPNYGAISVDGYLFDDASGQPAPAWEASDDVPLGMLELETHA